jgi:hypothetical protein
MRGRNDNQSEEIFLGEKSRRDLEKAIGDVETGLKEQGTYSITAIVAKETARKILDNKDNGLSPSEASYYGDRLRRLG